MRALLLLILLAAIAFLSGCGRQESVEYQETRVIDTHPVIE